MYKYIINPKTNKKYNINSKTGQNILYNYVRRLLYRSLSLVL